MAGEIADQIAERKLIATDDLLEGTAPDKLLANDRLPALAAALGAKPPWRVPALLAWLAVGEHGVTLMTRVRGASNAKAKRELGWRPAHASWRDGFRKGLAG
jgi:nucleoside-diphosphate-sugar epimerase